MISVSVTTDAAKAQAFLVTVTGKITDRRTFNEQLANRLTRELKTHFVAKNREPNKRGWKKSGFWSQVERSTAVAEVTQTGAAVSVADTRFNIHLFGGTIVPKLAKALTIPLIEEAKGESAASYKLKTGHRLFTIPGRDVLFEKAGAGNASESRVGGTRGRDRSFGVKLGARQPLRAVFALKASVTIDKDPDALPTTEILTAALQEEADLYLEFLNQQGPLT